MLAKVTTKGQITIPNRIRSRLRISYGDFVDFAVKDREVVLRKGTKPTDATSIRGILPAQRHATDDEIRQGRHLALSRRWAHA
jgi:AbrB family looped-hinge helix DNA binding protein